MQTRTITIESTCTSFAPIRRKIQQARPISEVHRVTRDLYFICGSARVPAVINLLYNAKVEMLESCSPRAGLRAFEKKKKRRKRERVSNVQ